MSVILVLQVLIYLLLTFQIQVGGTTLPPNAINSHAIFVPKNSDLFINVMHFVNWSQILF